MSRTTCSLFIRSETPLHPSHPTPPPPHRNSTLLHAPHPPTPFPRFAAAVRETSLSGGPACDPLARLILGCLAGCSLRAPPAPRGRLVGAVQAVPSSGPGLAEVPKRVLIVHSFGSAAPPFTTHSNE